MGNDIKKIFILLILLFGVIFNIGAKEVSKHFLTLGTCVTYQKIFYDDSDLYCNRDTLGPGLDVRYEYRTKNDSYLGLECSFEVFNYSNFYDYHDCKLSLNFRREIPGRLDDEEDDKLLFYHIGVGADYVLRDDSDKGLYPYACAGLIFDWKGTNNFDFIIKTTMGFTVQDGSLVFHSGGQIGILYRLDDLDGAKKQ